MTAQPWKNVYGYDEDHCHPKHSSPLFFISLRQGPEGGQVTSCPMSVALQQFWMRLQRFIFLASPANPRGKWEVSTHVHVSFSHQNRGVWNPNPSAQWSRKVKHAERAVACPLGRQCVTWTIEYKRHLPLASRCSRSHDQGQKPLWICPRSVSVYCVFVYGVWDRNIWKHPENWCVLFSLPLSPIMARGVTEPVTARSVAAEVGILVSIVSSAIR